MSSFKDGSLGDNQVERVDPLIINEMDRKNTMNYYKFLHERDGKIVSEHGEQTWEIGETYTVKGEVKACNNGFHASVEPLDALNYVKGNVLAMVEGSGDHDMEADKVCYRSMKIVRAYRWTATDSVTVAIYAAEQVIKIYEDKYPNDSRPRDAIKAAKTYLKDPTKKRSDAADAAYAARAADAAYAAARAAFKAKVNRYIKSRVKKLEEIK